MLSNEDYGKLHNNHQGKNHLKTLYPHVSQSHKQHEHDQTNDT